MPLLDQVGYSPLRAAEVIRDHTVVGCAVRLSIHKDEGHPLSPDSFKVLPLT
jgi:hypothetical protein